MVIMASRKKGFSTIDVLFALGIMGLMIGAYARQETENYSHERANSSANSVSAVMDATKFYIGNNYNALLSHLNVGQTMEIPLINNPTFMGIGDLATNSALLPSGFTGKIAKGQTLHLLLKHMGSTAGKPDYISGMVMTTGGANLTDREVGLAVNEMGLSGGGVMSRPPIGHVSSDIYGGYGTWSYPVSQWQVSGVTPSVGHIAMVTDSFALPIGDYLSRYNGSNPESIRMHTDLDMGNGEEGMTGNQINGVHAIFGANNQDTRLQDTYHSGRVNFGNGGIACANDSMGCHFDIGTKGGFYDNEDGWISFQNNSPTLGLKNRNTTDVLGATMDEAVLTRNNVSYSFSAGGAPGQGQDAALTYNGQWINATGGSGFQGLSSYLMQAQRFQDRSDNSYYFIPSQFSRLNDLQLAGQVATDGLDFKGGVHTRDAYVDFGYYVGNTDGRAAIMVHGDGDGVISGNAMVNGNIQTQGNISTNHLGNQLHPDESNWDALGKGGVHTSDLESSNGSLFVGQNYNNYAGAGLINASKLEVAGVATSSVFRTMGFRPIAGTSCVNNVQSHTPYTDQIIGVTLGGQARDNTPASYQYGDIAADASGQPLSCVNGTWKPIGSTLFSTFNGCNTANAWTNTSGQPEFVSAYSNTSHSESNYIEMWLTSPQGQGYIISSSSNPSDRGSKRYSVDGFVPNGWSARINSRFGVNGVCHWGGDVPGANNPTSLPDIPDDPDPNPVFPGGSDLPALTKFEAHQEWDPFWAQGDDWREFAFQAKATNENGIYIMQFQSLGGGSSDGFSILSTWDTTNMYCYMDWTTSTAEAIDNPSSGTTAQCSAFMDIFKYANTLPYNSNYLGYTASNASDFITAYYVKNLYDNNGHSIPGYLIDFFPDNNGFSYPSTLSNAKIIVDYDKYPNIGSSNLTWDQAGFTPKYDWK